MIFPDQRHHFPR
ncbi:hypothetical protein VCCP1035_2475A, partial [Vibrio cholerae CP1035(8)]